MKNVISMHYSKVLSLLAVVLLSFNVMSAQNLLTNGGFDTGLTGWTFSGNVQQLNQCSGAAFFNGGNTAPNAIISQDIVPTAGKNYQVSIDYAGQTPTQMLRLEIVNNIDSTVILSQVLVATTGSCSFGFQNYSTIINAPSADLKVRFVDVSTASFNTDFHLGEVVVEQVCDIVTNLIENPSFDTDLSNWTTSGNVQQLTYCSGAAVFNGGNSVPNAVISQDVNPTAGATCYISVDYAGRFSSQILRLEIVNNVDNTVVLSQVLAATNGQCFTGYLNYSAIITAPSADLKVRFTDISTATLNSDFQLGEVLFGEPGATLSSTGTSCPASADGSILVDASCGNCLGIEYSIDGTTFQSSNSFTNLAAGPYAVTVRDAGNNGCSLVENTTVVAGTDNLAPVADVANLPDVTVECHVTVTAPTATDNCTGSVTATTTDPTFYIGQGTYTITWTYDDGNGNTSTQTQTVVINDVTAPTITCPADVTTPANMSGCMAAVSNTPWSAIDNCQIASVTNDFNTAIDASGNYPLGNTVVTFTVTDVAGNTGTCSFNVTVTSDLVASAGPDQSVIFNSGSGPQPAPCKNLLGGSTGGTGSYTYSWAPATGLSNPNIAQPTACPTVNTTYTLTVTDALGCTSTDDVFVESIDINNSASLPCANRPCTKVFGCLNGNTVTVNVNASCNSSNSLCYLLANGGTLGMCTNNKDVPVAADLDLQFGAYPNPFATSTRLEFTSMEDEHLTIRVYNITGVEIAVPFDVQVNAGETYTVDYATSNLAEGTYFARLTTTSGKMKVIKLLLNRY